MSRSALTSSTALLLGALAVHCGPPVASRPPPTPVYAEQLTVPPAEVSSDSLADPASAQETAPPETPAAGEEDGQAPQEPGATPSPEPTSPPATTE